MTDARQRAKDQISLDQVTDWWSTAISDIEPGVIRLRGYPIEQLLRTRTSFVEMIWLMLRALPAEHQPDHLDERGARAQELLDGVPPQPDDAWFDVRDRRGPPVGDLVQRDLVLRPLARVRHTAPSSIRRSMASSSYPMAPRTSCVCSPSSAGGYGGDTCSPSTCAGPPSRWIWPPRVPGDGMIVTSPRCRTCSDAKACGTERTGAAGTPLLRSSSSHSRALRCFRVPSSSSRNSSRRRLRSSRDRKRGSVSRSGRVSTSHKISNCSCLLAAMFSLPSPVSKQPDGAEVLFSLPIATGS